MKKCRSCGEEKPLVEFYKHKKMRDGHINQCKCCVKSRVSKRELAMKDCPEWVDREKKRHRDKYHRLGYLVKHKPSKEAKKAIMDRYNLKYPEKVFAKAAGRYYRRITSIDESSELHHWSYSKKDVKDVIILNKRIHANIHRFIVYDKDEKKYRTLDNRLLDTNIEHYRYISRFFNNRD